MRGIKIGDFHTADDWNLLLTDKDLTPAEPNTTYVAVPGRSGSLDLSDVLTGEVSFSNRTYTASFMATEGTYEEREDLITKIVQEIHGRKLTLTTPDDDSRYLIGRVKVTSKANILPYGTIKISAECDPWLYNNEETVRIISVSGSTQTVTLTNAGRKTVLPSITVTGSITITVNGTAHALTAGEYKLADLTLKRGKTTIAIAGTGSAKFTYREAIL